VTELGGIQRATELSAYVVDQVIGRGGMGVVYRAWDRRLERNVALKILAPRYADDGAFRERLLRESRLAASLDHPNVVPVYEVGDSDGRFFLAMRYVEGTDLRALLRLEGLLPPARALEIASQVAAALDSAHARGLVHRDVKPSNVLIDESGHCYLADFGLTQSVSDRGQPTDGALLGTLDYVAPEQIRGDAVDGRADVYSLGCVIYECLTGEVPFGRSSEAAAIYAHLEDEIPRASEHRPGLPPGIDAVLPRAMAKRAEERQETCAELVEEVRAALGLEAAHVRGRRIGLMLAVAAVLVLLVAAAVAYLATSGSAPAAASPGVLLRIDPRSNEVVARAEIQGHPGNLVVSGGDVWMADFFEGVLWRYSPGTRALERITSNGEPRDLAALGPNIYVAADGEFLTGIVSRYDAATGIRKDGIKLLACAIAAGDGVVWTAGCPFVERLSTDGKPLRKLHERYLPYLQPSTSENTRVQFRELAVGAGSLWVLGDALDRRLWRLDENTGRIQAVLPLDFAPRSVAVGGGVVWITESLGDRVARIDSRSNRPLAPLHVGRSPGGVAIGAGSVWIPNSLDGTVTRLDLSTGATIATIDVGGFPREVAFGADSIWVTGYDG
jgi:predicted Ser/Thr protein kinase